MDDGEDKLNDGENRLNGGENRLDDGENGLDRLVFYCENEVIDGEMVISDIIIGIRTLLKIDFNISLTLNHSLQRGIIGIFSEEVN